MTGVAFFIERAMFKEKDGCQITVFGKRRQISADHLPEFLIGRNGLNGNARDMVGQHAEGAVEKRKQNLLLGRNMMVQAGFLQVHSIPS